MVDLANIRWDIGYEFNPEQLLFAMLADADGVKCVPLVDNRVYLGVEGELLALWY